MHINPHQQARRLRTLLQEAGHALSYTQAQQLVARSLGFRAWQELILHDDTRPAPQADAHVAPPAEVPAAPVRLAYVLTVGSEREQERGAWASDQGDLWELLCRDETHRQQLDDVIAALIQRHPAARVYTFPEPRMVVLSDRDRYDTPKTARDVFYEAAGDAVNEDDESETCDHCGQEVDADDTVLVNGHLYCTNCITDGLIDADATGECRECGHPYGPDPDGSEGVLVHRDEHGRPDYDRDRDHVPVPERD